LRYKGDMKPRLAAALTLVGWYLMLPPTQEMLDSACQWKHPTLTGEAKALVRGGGDENIVQCHLESLQLDMSAPLSKWDTAIAGTFETLAECQAEQKKPLTESEKKGLEFPALLDFGDDIKLRPKAATRLPKDFVNLYVQTRKSAIELSRCIATDDPRLKDK
jgi:hypothetical protein